MIDRALRCQQGARRMCWAAHVLVSRIEVTPRTRCSSARIVHRAFQERSININGAAD